MRFSAQNSAFTLIELLVVVSLITIMTGGLIPSFTKYLDDQNLKQAQEAVKNDLRSAQNKALAGSLSDDKNVVYWGIEFTNGSPTYEYLTSADANCNSTSNRSRGESLPGNVVIRRNGGPYCVLFSLANGDSNSSGTIYVYVGEPDAENTNCRSVTIASNGLIIATKDKVACPE